MYGLSPNLCSGSNLLSLPMTAAVYTGTRGTTAGGGGRGSTGCSVVYAAAALGVVHDLATNTQHFFDGHTDDVSCLCLSGDGRLAASGCVTSTSSGGKRVKGGSACVMVWETSTEALARESNGLVAVIGDKFFQRAVAAVTFTFDASCVVAIGCDDNHMLGVWSVSGVSVGVLLAQVSCLHGTPEAITGLVASAGLMYCDWITREHAGLCDVFCTTGEQACFTCFLLSFFLFFSGFYFLPCGNENVVMWV